MFEGYVLLFVMLVLIAYIFFERVDEMARNRVKREADAAPALAPWHRTSLLGEWLMRIGFALTTITGIMPSLAGNCHMQPTQYYEYCYEEVPQRPSSFLQSGCTPMLQRGHRTGDCASAPLQRGARHPPLEGCETPLRLCFHLCALVLR